MKKFFLFFIAAALVCAFAMPAAAMEEKTSEELIESLMKGVGGWTLYGSARMTTFRVDDGDDEDTQWDLQGNSRLGARVSHGNWGGRFEFAVNDESGVNTRLLYGTYKVGNGTLSVGQNYTPLSRHFYSNQVFGSDYDLLNSGQLYTSRRPAFQFTTAGFTLALVEPATQGSIMVGEEERDVDTTLPKIEVGYNFSKEMFFVDLSAGYQTVDVGDDSWDSVLGEIGVGINAGPARVRLAAHYIENGGLYNVWSLVKLGSAYDANGNQLDNEAMGYLGVLDFRASDMLSFQAGAGFRETEVGDAEDEVITYYGQTVIRLLSNVFIVPEVGVVDIDSKGDKTTYFGAKTQINW